MKPLRLPAVHSLRAEKWLSLEGGDLSEAVRHISGHTALLIVLAVISGRITALATIFAYLLL